MLFKEITLQEKDEITPFTLNSPYQNCDLSFSNLCSWQFMYHTKYAIEDGFLFLKFWVEGTAVYMFPVGQGDIAHAIKLLQKDAHEAGHPFCLLGITQQNCEHIEELMPGKFQFYMDQDYSDYIYLRESLSTLSGKKLQAKRNHVNKFKKSYTYDFLPITKELIPECIEEERNWCIKNHCDEQEGTGNERKAILYALHNFEELGLTGGVLHVDGKIAAFTFGMPINENTFGIHVEKADTDINGAYAMINYEFANMIPEQYIYINREEDLGIEGLRKAKQSYNPALLLDKYMAVPSGDELIPIKW